MTTDRLASAASCLVDNLCRLTVWWTHNRAKFTTPRQAAFAAWNEAFRASQATPIWQSIETAPREHGKPILVSWPVRALDDDDMPTGPILRRVTLITEMNGDQWLDPDVCNASGAWFGDDYAYAEQPDLWQPLPAAPAA